MDGNGRPDAAGKKSKGEKRLSCSPAHVMELVLRARCGEVAAEHELHRIFEPKLRAALAPHRSDRSVAEELDGEGYLLLHDCIMRFDARWGVSFFTFLDRMLRGNTYSVVRRERRDARRCQPASAALAAGDEAGGDAPADPEEALEAAIQKERRGLALGKSVEEIVVLRRTLAEEMEKLTAPQRKVVMLRAEGYSFREIAAELGGTIQGWRQAFRRARQRLRKALEEML